MKVCYLRNRDLAKVQPLEGAGGNYLEVIVMLKKTIVLTGNIDQGT